FADQFAFAIARHAARDAVAQLLTRVLDDALAQTRRVRDVQLARFLRIQHDRTVAGTRGLHRDVEQEFQETLAVEETLEAGERIVDRVRIRFGGRVWSRFAPGVWVRL